MNRFLALVLTMMLTFSKAYAFNFDEWMDTNVAPISDAIANVIFYQINLFGVKVPIIICWVLFAGIFFTIYFRGISIWGFKHAIQTVAKTAAKTEDGIGEVSAFEALATAL